MLSSPPPKKTGQSFHLKSQKMLSRLPSWRVHFWYILVPIKATQSYALPRFKSSSPEITHASWSICSRLASHENEITLKTLNLQNKINVWVFPDLPGYIFCRNLRTFHSQCISHCQIKVKSSTEYGRLYERFHPFLNPSHLVFSS